MLEKSKTKKVFVDQPSRKPPEQSSLSSIMRRFKSHDVYASLKSTKSKNPKTLPSKQSDNTTITINLNLPQPNTTPNNPTQLPKNPKKGIADKQRDPSGKFKTTITRTKIPKDQINPNSQARMLDQIYSMKILNEESIQELDTEDNCKLMPYIIPIDNIFDDEKTTGTTTEAYLNENEGYGNKYMKNSNNGGCCSIDMSNNPNRKLILAAKKGDKELVLELIDVIINKNNSNEDGDNGLNYKDENGWNAMHYACEEGNLKIVEILLKANIDINSKTNDKKTPLHLASRNGYFDISKLLIENEAVINMVDNEKNTPIHLCTIANHLELLKFLCSKSGNKVDRKNVYGKTPLDLATNDDTKNLLKQYVNSSSNANAGNNVKEIRPSQMLTVKIHTANTKHANTLIKDMNRKEINAPAKYDVNPLFMDDTTTKTPGTGNKLAVNTPNANATGANPIKPMRSKPKFTNNNNITTTITSSNNTTTQTSLNKPIKDKPQSQTQAQLQINRNNDTTPNKSSAKNSSKHDSKKKIVTYDPKLQNPKPLSNIKMSHSQSKKQFVNAYSSVPKNGNNSNTNRPTSQSLGKRNNMLIYKPNKTSYNDDVMNKGMKKKDKVYNSNQKKTQKITAVEITLEQPKMIFPIKKKGSCEIRTTDCINQKESKKDNDENDKSSDVIDMSSEENDNEILDEKVPDEKKVPEIIVTEKKVPQIVITAPEVIVPDKEGSDEVISHNELSPKKVSEDKEVDSHIEAKAKHIQEKIEKEVEKVNIKQEKAEEKNEEDLIHFKEDEEQDQQDLIHFHEDNKDQEEEQEDEESENDDDDENCTTDEEKIGPSSFMCLALLGKGSFGEVYLVKKINTNLLYAMKVLDKDKIMGQNIVKYAKTERNVLSLTSHPFIVKLNFAFQTNEKLFLLLDYCAGGDLAEQLSLEIRFPEQRAKIYLCEIILALGDLHQKNIIFRDLKPDNVVLDSDGHAMLTDFGLSREGVFDAKIAKSFCGSIAYLAPEMLSRKGHGKAVDWYLLGVLFYEMLVGIPPYYAKNKDQIFKNIQMGELQIPKFVSPKAGSLLRALLKRDPNDRLGSINDVEEIKENEYFNDVNWDEVYNRELKPPIPNKINALKTFKQPKMFADENNTPSMNMSDLPQKFEGWSFIQNPNNPNQTIPYNNH